jgi:large subunit ribosomal protein L16
MGKGKGNVEYWTAAVKRGRVMFEIEGVSKEVAEAAFRTASFKLPIKVKLLAREGMGG